MFRPSAPAATVSHLSTSDAGRMAPASGRVCCRRLRRLRRRTHLRIRPVVRLQQVGLYNRASVTNPAAAASNADVSRRGILAASIVFEKTHSERRCLVGAVGLAAAVAVVLV